MSKFFYKYWWFYYLLLFILIGWFIYSLYWEPSCKETTVYIREKKEVRNDEIVKEKEKVKIVACNSEVKSGGQGMTKTTHSLGSSSGRIYVEYDMKKIPDKMEVFYDGKIVATTEDFVSYEGNLSFYYSANPNNPSICTIVISAPNEKTAWAYRLNCPQ